MDMYCIIENKTNESQIKIEMKDLLDDYIYK